MLKRLIRSALASAGYEIRRAGRKEETGLFLYSYLKADGSFDYDRYRRVQTEGNKRKLDHVWVSEENVVFLSEYIKALMGAPEFGICHGTRRGKEQEWFGKYLGCEVIGTEISDTAEQFPNTVRWDFHEVQPSWTGAADFIYSNSFDHSYDPQKCLNAWMSCIKPGGVCILEHTSAHTPAGTSELDPFGADIVQMAYLITVWGEGRYGVRELLKPPKSGADPVHFIVVGQY